MYEFQIETTEHTTSSNKLPPHPHRPARTKTDLKHMYIYHVCIYIYTSVNLRIQLYPSSEQSEQSEVLQSPWDGETVFLKSSFE